MVAVAAVAAVAAAAAAAATLWPEAMIYTPLSPALIIHHEL